MLLLRRAARPASSVRLWRPQGMMCEAAHTMRVPQGTRGAVCTSTRRLNEASPKLSMTIDEHSFHLPGRSLGVLVGRVSPFDNVRAQRHAGPSVDGAGRASTVPVAAVARAPPPAAPP